MCELKIVRAVLSFMLLILPFGTCAKLVMRSHHFHNTQYNSEVHYAMFIM